jgi:1-acyl-sn-glycerol-3-phosphate acyltransferase
MVEAGYSIAYPRRRIQRGAIRTLARVLVPALAQVEVRGCEHFPEEGPLLVVGNHIAAMEVVLMLVYSPWQVELLGPGDLPPQRAIGVISRAYGYTGIQRGQADRRALSCALDVLRQGGVVGIFPEGGIWDTGIREAKRGVAWLSHRAQAPILPIGFGGVKGALDEMLKLKRPHLSMNVGTLMPAVTCDPGQSRKACLQEAADRVLQAVMDLVPEAERPERDHPLDERFELRVVVRESQPGMELSEDSAPASPGADPAAASEMPVPEGLAIVHTDALCKFFYRPALLNILHKDVYLPVEALQDLKREHDPARIAAAVQCVLGYLDENPYFLTYRYGQDEGQAMGAGLQELHDLATWAALTGASLHLTPIRRYFLPGREGEIVEDDPGETYVW